MKALFFFVSFDLFVALVCPVSAQGRGAQPPAAPRPPRAARMEVSAGAGFLGGSSLGTADADLRGRGNQPFELFDTSSRIGGSVPLEVRLDFLLGPRYVFEIRGAWSRPALETSVTGDVEGAPPVTLVEDVDQYSLDFGLLVNLRPARSRSLVPFLSAGVGYVGAVHEGLTLLENGIGFRGGGGLKYPLVMQRRGRIKGFGIRADAAFVVMTSGLATESGTTRQVATSGSLYFSF
jgi:hypothetical protein